MSIGNTILLLDIAVVVGSLIGSIIYIKDDPKKRPDLAYVPDPHDDPQTGPTSKRANHMMLTFVISLFSLLIVVPIVVGQNALDKANAENRVDEIKYQRTVKSMQQQINEYQEKQNQILAEMKDTKMGSNAYKDAQVAYYQNHDKLTNTQQKLHQYIYNKHSFTIHWPN